MNKLFSLVFNFIIYYILKRKRIPEEFHEEKPTEVVDEKPMIVNKIKELPWHETRMWSKRALNDITQIVIHQAASTGTLEGINKYHITPSKDNHISSDGAPHICYHYVIDKEGVIFKTNALSHTTWHCKGQNSKSIGILVLGHFSGPSFEGKEEPTTAQKDSLVSLLDDFSANEEPEDAHTKGLFIDPSKIYGHCDFGKINCPGTEIFTLIENYKKDKTETA